MAVDIHKLIAAISPDTYCDPSVRDKTKKKIKEGLKNGDKDIYLKVAEGKGDFEGLAKPYEGVSFYSYDSAKKDPFSLYGLKVPVEKHVLTYDSPSEQLEPVYFWIHDFSASIGLKVEKLIDNFASSPGSSHFSELQGKATRMQEEAMKALGAVNQVMKSILNIVYDLRDFQMRLKLYDKLKSDKPEEKEQALLSLKQIWLDTVDATKRGTTSIKAMAQQFDFVTLIDGFFATNSLKDVDKLDLNERVKRILKQRVGEFEDWITLSEKELRKRYEIEKTYLKSQYNTVKLYARWIKPYLRAAKKLEQPFYNEADLITAFNTVILQLSVMIKSNYDPEDDVNDGILPDSFKNSGARKYTPFFLVELKFRSIPQKVGQHYSFGGRADVTFTSYALNDQELKVLKKQLEKDDIDDVMEMIEGATAESLGQLQNDIDELLGNDKKKDEKKKKDEDVNPFTALFEFFKISSKKDDWEESKPIPSDSEYEKIIRSQASLVAQEKCFLVFDVYKKSHGMPSHDNPFEPL